MAGPDTTSSGWSDLPTDLLTTILELPAAFAFAAVCTSWRSAAAAAGIPPCCTPWLMSWAHLVEKRESKVNNKNDINSAVTCKFRHLLDVGKAYDVTFPKGCFATCCGSSHGWLVLVNELCNLLLYNPFTSGMIPLPPVTDFTSVEPVYADVGKMQGYRLDENPHVYDSNYLAISYYSMAVLSCRPSKGGTYILATIHHDSNWVSFARAREGTWQVVSTLKLNQSDRYTDCAFHDGRLYTVTYHGTVERWNLDEPANMGPTKEVLVTGLQNGAVLTRHLLPTPWGDLLRVSAVYEDRMDGSSLVRFMLGKVRLGECKELPP
jgi:hypothetical protein